MQNPSNTPIGAGPLTGRTLGDFLVMEKLAEGGVGMTYRAQQTLLGREAVVKVLLAGGGADGLTQGRFLREARLASRLDHPYAVAVYSFGAEADGLLWIAMELVPGITLGQYIKLHGPMPLARFAPFFDALCEVVDAVHDKGIIHRDIKPSNVMVMVRNGRLLPKLLDLGVATVAERAVQSSLSLDDDALFKMLTTTSVRGVEETGAIRGGGNAVAALTPEKPTDRHELYAPVPTPALNLESTSLKTPTTLNRIELAEKLSITRADDAIGSPAYMAPEQWLNSRDVTPQADVYSLGILAWQTLTGALPYLAKTTSEVAMAHLQAPIPTLPAGFPEGLQAVLAKALAKGHADRHAKAGELGRALMAVATATQRVLPSVPEGLRHEWVDAAPQPLAETLALLSSVRTAQAGFEVALRALRLLARSLALVGVLCRQRRGPASAEDEESLKALLIAVRNGRLEHSGWVALLWSVVHPWAKQPLGYPVPGLLTFCVTATGEKTEAMLALETAELDETPTSEEAALPRLEQLVSKLTPVLRAADFLLRQTLARASAEPGIFESYSGCRRPVRATFEVRMHSAVEGDLFLIDETLTPTLRLNPLIQALAPSPGEPPDIFLFSGAGRYGARLVSAPRELERQDELTWVWLDTYWPRPSRDSDLTKGQDKPPYRGLASFTASDAQDFFGREPEAQAVANRLRVSPFLAVVGPSGVGKSSFVQAGVAPLLADDLVTVVVRPGNTPLATLLLKLKGLGVETFGLQQDPSKLGKRLGEHAAKHHSRYLLIIDQFEELITLCQSPSEREAYASALLGATRLTDDSIRVVITLRDDFLIRAQAIDALKDHLSTGLHLLGTPGEPELIRILTEPLKRVGYAFEDPELPRQMVKEVSQQPGALALLSFSATKLWAGRDTHFRRLTRQAYQVMGGVGGALAGHAEETLAAMSEDERKVTREAFRHLVSGSGTRAVLTRADANELLGSSATGSRVLEKLIDARLLVTSETEGGDDRVEIIHEALLSSWPRLVQWQRENAELARVRDALRSASRQWHDQKRPRGMLWRDETLTEYRLWRPKYPGALTAIEQAFAQASVAEFERGRRLRRGLLIGAFAVLSVGIVVLVRANGRAEANALESARRLTLMTAEQGRQLFLSGHPLEAQRLLTAAADAGVQNAGVRYMLQKAGKAVSLQRKAIDLSVTAMALAPHASSLAVGQMDGTVSVLNSQTFELQETAPSFTASVRSLRFTDDGAALVGCSADGTLSVLNAASLSPIASLKLEPGLVTCEPHDGWIAAGGVSSHLQLLFFDGNSLKKGPLFDYKGPTIRGVRRSPNGRQFVVVMAEAAGPPIPTQRYPIESFDGPRVWLTGLHGQVLAAAWSADGQTVFTAGEDSTITQWDSHTGSKRGELNGHKGAVVELALGPDGTTLFSAGTDGTLRRWDPTTKALLSVARAHEGALRHLVISPRGLVVTGGYDTVIRMWSGQGQLRQSMPPQPGGLPTLVVDSDGDQVISGSLAGVNAYQLSSAEFVASVAVPSDTAGFSLDGAETQLLVGAFDGPFVRYPLDSAQKPEPLRVSLVEDRAFALAPDGGFIVTDRGTAIASLDLENRVIREFASHVEGEGTVVLNDSATHVLATGNQEEPLLYELKTGTQRRFPEPVKTITAVFSHSGPSDVWVGTGMGELIFWPEHGGLRRTSVARVAVVCVQESPDGRLVAVATIDQRLHVLRADTLDEVSVGVAGVTATSLGFAPNSDVLVAGDRSGLVQVWNLAPFEQIDSRKVGQKLFQLTTLRTRRQFLTLTPEGLLTWSL